MKAAPSYPRVALGCQVENARLAGGVDSPVRAGRPVGAPSPLVVRGKGSRVNDSAGREYIDYLCAYGPVILGHADVRISRAVRNAMRNGALFGTTHPEEVRLAQRLCERFPSLERVRLVSTGTEACMSAVRVARAFTGREKIVRFAGCYHGQSDQMIFSAGASSLSSPSIQCGVTKGVVNDVFVLAYNDVGAIELLFREDGQDIAAVIVEPVCANMGLCLPDLPFIHTLRKLTQTYGSVLIFDEVITAFRNAGSGAQGELGVIPDLTCLGKALGGGLPIAAFGGRAEITNVLAPLGPVFVGGTFSGNPLCVAAANAFLDAIAAKPNPLEKASVQAEKLARGFEDIINRAGLGYPVVRWGSMVDFMFRPGRPHRDAREAQQADASAYARYYHRMLERGILLAPSQMEVMFLTAAHSDEDVERTLEAARYALA